MLSITQKQAKRWRPKRSLKICVVVACCFARYGADTRLHRIARGVRVLCSFFHFFVHPSGPRLAASRWVKASFRWSGYDFGLGGEEFGSGTG
jgi:hypothetical protein